MKRILLALVPVIAVVALVVPVGTAHAATVNYVALGDSYSSGDGTNHYDLNASCYRGSLAYPVLVANARGYNLNFQACGGATTTDVINNQLSALSTSTNLVTITAGGNDIGFMSMIVTCTLSNCVSAMTSATNTLSTTLAPNLDAMYTQIKTRAPNASVIVLGYPHLFSGTCLSALGISSAEVTAANKLADAIDTVMKTEVAKPQYAGFVYKSAITQFTGHGVCASRPWINGLNLGSVVESYHPNTSGYSSGYEPLVLSVAP